MHRMRDLDKCGLQLGRILPPIELSDKDMSRIKPSIADNAQGDEADFVSYNMVTTLQLLLPVFPYRSLCCSAS